MSHERLAAGRNAMWRALVAAGWQESIGLNDLEMPLEN
jgi:hypothetical protein